MRLPPRDADWRAGLWAGLIAGLVDEALLAGMALLQGASPWSGMKASAAMALGPGVLEAPDAFSLKIVVAALAIHFALSMVLGIVAAALLRRHGAAACLAIGVVYGLAVYTIDFFVFAPLYFPWLVPMRALAIVPASHALFGLVLAAAYVALRIRERRSGLERRTHLGQIEPGRRRLADRRYPAMAWAPA